MTIASGSWRTPETDPQRQAILAAADRLLGGAPMHSSGNLSVVQLAIEAQVKYWIVAQRHTDLRDHFQTLVRAVNSARRSEPKPEEQLRAERDQLRQHCAALEKLLAIYATVINELALENQVLRDQLATPLRSVVPIRHHRQIIDS